jgi:hypothetical protein
MSNRGIAYKIKEGDTLWSIAADKLGSPLEWPRIYAFNNTAAALQAGARRIKNPDLIYAGDVIRLPIIEQFKTALPRRYSISDGPDRARVSAETSKTSRLVKPSSLKEQLPYTKIPYSFAMDLRIVPEIELKYGSFVARINLTGRLAIQLRRQVQITFATNKTLEAMIEAEGRSAANQLIAVSDVTFNPYSKEIRISSKMVSNSQNNSAPKVAIGVESRNLLGPPTLRGEIIYPELRGRLGNDDYLAFEVTFSVEIEPNVDRHQKMAPVAAKVAAKYETAADRVDWAKAAYDGALKTLSDPKIPAFATIACATLFLAATRGRGAPVFANPRAVSIRSAALLTVSKERQAEK